MISAGYCSGSDYIVGVAGSGPVGQLRLHALQPSKGQELWQKLPDKIFPFAAQNREELMQNCGTSW